MKKSFIYAVLAYINGVFFLNTLNYIFMFSQIVFIILALKEFLWNQR
jgi:hypothetical protein